MTDIAPLSPDEFPPELQETLRRMSNRGPVVDMGTGQRVAEDGRLTTDPIPLFGPLGRAAQPLTLGPVERFRDRDPAPRVLGQDVFDAQLSQQDPGSGLRGWRLYVALPGMVAHWPERVWSRQAAARPPLIRERLTALAELGFEPAGEDGREPECFAPADLWHWQETWAEAGSRRRTPLLFASITVRRITTGKEN